MSPSAMSASGREHSGTRWRRRFAEARAAIQAHGDSTIDVLYGDAERGQRMVSRYTMVPRDDGQWLAAVARHWNLDRDEPR
jgi:hypothetical protein